MLSVNVSGKAGGGTRHVLDQREGLRVTAAAVEDLLWMIYWVDLL